MTAWGGGAYCKFTTYMQQRYPAPETDIKTPKTMQSCVLYQSQIAIYIKVASLLALTSFTPGGCQGIIQG